MTRPAVALGVVAVLLAGALGLSTATPPEPSASAASGSGQLPVEETTAVCPLLPDPGAGAISSLSAGSLGLPGRSGEGALHLGVPGDPQGPVLRGDAGVVLGDLPLRPDGGAQVVRATGGLAAGSETELVTRTERGRARGLAGQRCPAPARDAWYAGANTQLRVESTLYLVNPTTTQAVVDVTLFGVDGMSNPDAAQGIEVPPGTRVALDLGGLAPAEEALTVHVHTREGLVASGVRLIVGTAQRPGGVDWLPAVSEPAQQVVLTGVPKGPGSRALVVTNPADTDTAVAVERSDERDQSTPGGYEAVRVPARSTVVVNLTRILDGDVGTVIVSSEPPAAGDTPVDQLPIGGAAAATAGPDGEAGAPGADGAAPPSLSTATASGGTDIVAALRMVDAVGADPFADIAFVGAAPALDGPALVTDLGDARTAAFLFLSATAGGGSVTLAPVAASGTPAPGAPIEVPLTGGTTTAVDLRARFPAAAGLIVTPTPGTVVQASRYLREKGEQGALATSLPLVSAPRSRPSRPVVADPAAGLAP